MSNKIDVFFRFVAGKIIQVQELRKKKADSCIYDRSNLAKLRQINGMDSMQRIKGTGEANDGKQKGG